MATTQKISANQVDLNQGTDDKNNTFGYVCGDDGGYFFTWMESLEKTLDSIEEDEIDGDGGLDEGHVNKFLAEYLPTTKRGIRMWGSK